MKTGFQKLKDAISKRFPNSLMRRELEIEEGQMLFTNFEASIKHMVRFYDRMS
ncbi:hypothetical protein [Luteibaculum oceani]|uniref:hypothetical protein n=1 Tax=Luteibaculum oceani TaxID=1294296 RepID=UPI0014771A09|nr:hypothetical protein [Luteibaculum oceani]